MNRKLVLIVAWACMLSCMFGCGKDTNKSVSASEALQVEGSEASESAESTTCEDSVTPLQGLKTYEGLTEFIDSDSGRCVAIGNPMTIVRDTFEDQLILSGDADTIGPSFTNNITVMYNESNLVYCIGAMGLESSFEVLGLSVGSPISDVADVFEDIAWDDDYITLYFDANCSRCSEFNAHYALDLIRDNGVLTTLMLKYIGPASELQPTADVSNYETKAEKRAAEYESIVDDLTNIYENQEGVTTNITYMHGFFNKEMIDLRIYYDIAFYDMSNFQNLVCDVIENVNKVVGDAAVSFNAFQISIVESGDSLASSILQWNCFDDSDLTIGTIEDKYNDRSGYNISAYEINDWFIESATEPTGGERNALSKAHDYLRYTSFSYSGLIEQLEFEGYTTEEATYGADNCGADWYEQAVKKAADYLDYTSFSRDGLISQLEFEGFTHDQAVYGAEQNGY